jgi:hypothetical protein
MCIGEQVEPVEMPSLSLRSESVGLLLACKMLALRVQQTIEGETPSASERHSSKEKESVEKRVCAPFSLSQQQQRRYDEMLHLGGHEDQDKDQHKDGSYAADDTAQQASKCIVICAVCLAQPGHPYDASTSLLPCCSPGYRSLPSSPLQTQHTTMSPNTTAPPSTPEYNFQVNYKASSGPAAAEHLTQQSSNYGGLVVNSRPTTSPSTIPKAASLCWSRWSSTCEIAISVTPPSFGSRSSCRREKRRMGRSNTLRSTLAAIV